jgi:hypothetical protein
MPDYKLLEKFCRAQSILSRDSIDSFLIYYAAAKDKADKAFDTQISRYNKAAKTLPASWAGMAKSQFIAHRIFREDGLIHGYLKHTAVKNLPPEQYMFLQEQSESPWMFRFCSIVSRPAPDFFLMEDVFREEEFLLFSPSLTQTLAEQPVLLCFLLTGFNGDCWQSFGPFVSFSGFDPDDIFFFATEQNPEIYDEEGLIRGIEENPVPYMLLITGSTYPRMVQDKFEIVHVGAEAEMSSLDIEKAKKHFTVEYSPPVFKLTSGDYESPPHFAAAYYHEEKGILSLSAMTDLGYHQMQLLLNKCRLPIAEEPEIRVHLFMIKLIKDILGKTIDVHPYDKLFDIKSSPAADRELAKINHLLQMALPAINAGKDPDIEALAKQAGVDLEIAREIIGKSLERVKKLKK